MLEDHGVSIAAVSYDPLEKLAAFSARHGIGYPLLSDSGSAVIRAFGIFNFNMAPDLRAYGVPHPVEYLVSTEGVVIRKYFVENYQHRVTGSGVALQEFGAVATGAPSVTLKSSAMTARIGLASARAFAGQELSFFAQFAIEPGWHIYGSVPPEGSRATAVIFDDPQVVRQSFETPAVELISGSLQVIGSLLLKFPLDEGEIQLRGRLDFQQCSDTVCEPPESIAFELPLTLERFLVADRV